MGTHRPTDQQTYRPTERQHLHFLGSIRSQKSIFKLHRYEFPRLYSWTKEAKQSMFSLFNYMENASFRGDLKLSEPDFQSFSLPSLCSEAKRRSEFEDYCKLSENLPDLDQMMHLMHLAEYPLDFNENIKNLFK